MSTTPPSAPQPVTTKVHGRARSGSLSTTIPSHPLSVPTNFSRAFQSPPPPLSISPTSTAASEGLATPSSSPSYFSPPLSASTGKKDEDLFANGARWGWPSSNSTATAPPAQRRASMSVGVSGGPTYPMAPLSRVSSAGASFGAQSEKAGWGIFRRFSTGAPATRPKPPSPPPSMINGTTSHSIPEFPAPMEMPAEDRGRKSLSPGTAAAKPKRRISPMGERILRGSWNH